METLVVGDVVVVPFPHSNFREFKRRPAVVVTPPMGEDILLCQITSRADRDQFVIPLTDDDMAEGKLLQESFVRPNKISTMDLKIIEYRIGSLKQNKQKIVLSAIKSLFDR
jgi:mRNA interferase MazF